MFIVEQEGLTALMLSCSVATNITRILVDAGADLTLKTKVALGGVRVDDDGLIWYSILFILFVCIATPLSRKRTLCFFTPPLRVIEKRVFFSTVCSIRRYPVHQ